MTGIRTNLATVALAALLGGLACTPVRNNSFRGSFLPPPSPGSNRGFVTPDPPAIERPVEVAGHESPRFLVPGQNAAGKPAREDLILREADWHYQLGRKHYQEGDEGGARREFDRAIDALLAAPEGISRAALDTKIEELVDAVHRLDLAGLGAADVASEPFFEKPPLEDLPPMTFPVDPSLKNKLAEELRATVSQLPLEINDEVLAYVNYFSTGRGRKILVYGLRRSGRYRSLIKRILDEEGVPQELIYLAQAESGFLSRAVSRMKATGMWQFVLLRGREYGLNQSPYADDRFDPEKATRAAARHLRDLYHRYGDWYLAIAAYNCGPGVVDRAVERTGYADFWELRRRSVLPRETSNYVPIILAITIMAKNAREYGLENLDPDPALEYDVVDISAPTHLQLIADLTESPVSQLRELNPSLLRSIAPAGASVRVPKSTGASVSSALDSIPAAKRAAWRIHRVIGGDSLDAIARRYRVTRNSIVAANGATVQSAEPGDLLIIPSAPEPEKPVVRRARRGARATTAASVRAGKTTAASARGGKTPAPAALRARSAAHKTHTRGAASRRKSPVSSSVSLAARHGRAATARP